MIELKNLSKSYGSKKVLKDINVLFASGKVHGIVGQNGAGKTTLFRCIAELEDYDGKIISNNDDLKKHLGLLTSEPYFLPKITGEEHIYILADARRVKVENIIDQNIFKLPLKEYVSDYSTGMKKKLAIMAVLIQKNEYFIFDEPYNGIDLESSIILTAIIEKLKSLGKTILISSHIFSTLKESCDQIFLLEDGVISAPFNKESFDQLEDEMKNKILIKDIDKLIL